MRMSSQSVYSPQLLVNKSYLQHSEEIRLVWSSMRSLGTESTLHLEMKAAVASRLHDEGCKVVMELPYSPSWVVWWSSYRPDVFGVRGSEGLLEYTFVECETNPFAQRILRKRIDSVGYQSRLLEKLQVRFLLVVPRGKLARVSYASIRRLLEIWTYEKWSGSICKYPSLSLG